MPGPMNSHRSGAAQWAGITCAISSTYEFVANQNHRLILNHKSRRRRISSALYVTLYFVYTQHRCCRRRRRHHQRSLLVHDSPQHPHWPHRMNEKAATPGEERRERPSSSVPYHSSALLWESFKLWEWNAVKQYTYTVVHKATHIHSTRFMPTEQWNETLAVCELYKRREKKKLVEANGIKRIMCTTL